jgi:uncharacterized protein YaeQ
MSAGLNADQLRQLAQEMVIDLEGDARLILHYAETEADKDLARQVEAFAKRLGERIRGTQQASPAPEPMVWSAGDSAWIPADATPE